MNGLVFVVMGWSIVAGIVLGFGLSLCIQLKERRDNKK